MHFSCSKVLIGRHASAERRVESGKNRHVGARLSSDRLVATQT